MSIEEVNINKTEYKIQFLTQTKDNPLNDITRPIINEKKKNEILTITLRSCPIIGTVSKIK